MAKHRTMETDMFNLPIKKKGINGKAKGSTNERAASAVVTAWVGEPFGRVPGSGSLRWKDATNTAADIMCQNSEFYFPFVIETKHLKSLCVTKELRVNSDIYRIWKQTIGDATRAGKLPMALLRENGMHTFEWEGKKYQDYYLVLERRFMGMMLCTQVRPVFYGDQEDKDYMLVGYLFSDVVKTYSYRRISNMIENGNFVAKFKEHVNFVAK